jgi:hypothetical protein
LAKLTVTALASKARIKIVFLNTVLTLRSGMKLVLYFIVTVT